MIWVGEVPEQEFQAERLLGWRRGLMIFSLVFVLEGWHQFGWEIVIIAVPRGRFIYLPGVLEVERGRKPALGGNMSKEIDLTEVQESLVPEDYVREPYEVEVTRFDSNFRVTVYPVRDVGYNFTVYADEVYVDGQRAESPELIDAMARVQPYAEEVDGQAELAADPESEIGYPIEFEVPVGFTNPRVALSVGEDRFIGVPSIERVDISTRV